MVAWGSAGANGQPKISEAARIEDPVTRGRIRLQPLAQVVHDEAVPIDAEVAGACVRTGSAVAQHEETFAANGQIQTVLREIDVPLAELLCDVRQTDTASCHSGASALDTGRKDFGEFGSRALEADRVDVGNVVGGHSEIRRRCVQATQGDTKWHGPSSIT